MPNVDSNVSSRGLRISQVEVQIYPMLSFLTLSTCVYTIYNPSSDFIVEFLRMRGLRKIHSNSETTKQGKNNVVFSESVSILRENAQRRESTGVASLCSC